MRLKGAEENLTRLEDVLKQVDAQIDSLKRQARQASRYKSLASDIRKYEALVALSLHREAATGLAEAERKLEADVREVAERTTQQAEAARLQAIAEKTGVIGDVRGRGAMIAVEIVKPGTDTPDADLTNAVAKACHAQGVVVLTAGTYGNVLRFLPPLVIPDHLLDEALTVIEEQFLALTGH